MGKPSQPTTKAVPSAPAPVEIATPLPQAGAPARTWARTFGPVVVVLLAFLAYAPTLWNGFAFDDTVMIGENKLIRSLRNVPRLLVSDYWAAVERPDLFANTALYRPLVTLSFALNYALGGLKPFGYHLVNLLLHAGVSLAVFGVGRQLGLARAGATVAAALFAVHPLHTEAVAQIVGRAELLMALGVLLGLGLSRRGRPGGALAAFALALLAKEQAMVLPALLLLTELPAARPGSPPASGVVRGLWTRAALRRLLPALGVLGAYLLLRAWVLGGEALPEPDFLDNPLADAPLGPRLLTALAVAGRYLRLCLWPVPLSPDYSYNQIPLATSPLDGRVLLALLLWGGLLVCAGRSLTRGRGRAAFAVAFTGLTFLPAANLLLPIGTIMGERLFYLPSVGLCWLAGLAWEAGRARRVPPRLGGWSAALLGTLLGAFTAQTLRYGRHWRDDFTLFSYAVQVAPRNAKMQYFFGSLLLERADRKDEAAARFRRATEISPEYAIAWNALGQAYLNTQQWEQAVTAFQRGIRLDPDDPYPHNNLGLAYAALGRWDEAMAAFRQAVARKPNLVQAHRNLAHVYERRGWTEAALAERALELNPTDPVAWLQAGTTYLQLRWPAEALGALEEAVRLGPALPEAHRRLAELYTTQLPDPAKAQAHLREAEGKTSRPDPLPGAGK